MQCLAPVYKYNPEYENHPNQPRYITFPCGKCAACMERRVRSWVVRFQEELRNCDGCYFITLTYEGAPLNGVSVDDLQLFMKRLRKRCTKDGVKLKHFLVSEYGPETFRPHYHGLIFSFGKHYKYDEFYQLVDAAWQKGFVSSSQATIGRMRYVAGYFLNKMIQPPNQNKVFTVMSKGIGKSYIERNKNFYQTDDYFNRTYSTYYGHKDVLPRYWKDKLFSEHQKSIIQRYCEEKANKFLAEELQSMDLSELEKLHYEQRSAATSRLLKYHKKTRKI